MTLKKDSVISLQVISQVAPFWSIVTFRFWLHHFSWIFEAVGMDFFFFSVVLCHGWQIYLKDMIQINGSKNQIQSLFSWRTTSFSLKKKKAYSQFNLMDVIKSTFIDLACLSSLLEGAITLRLNGNEWLAKSWSSAACPQENHQESSRCVSAGGSDVWHLHSITSL